MKSAFCMLVGELMYIVINTTEARNQVCRKSMLPLYYKSHQGTLNDEVLESSSIFSDILHESNI